MTHPTSSLVAVLLFTGFAVGAEPLRVKEFSLADPAGVRHTQKEWQDHKAIVLVFAATECPVSNGYSPTFTRIAKAHQSQGVAFYLVYPDPDVTAEIAKKHAAEYRLDDPAIRFLLDPKQVLAAQAGATRTPECVVLTTGGEVKYRGRVDDRYSEKGRRRDEPTTRELQDAIEAVLADKTPDPAVTKAFGCPLPPPAKP